MMMNADIIGTNSNTEVSRNGYSLVISINRFLCEASSYTSRDAAVLLSFITDDVRHVDMMLNSDIKQTFRERLEEFSMTWEKLTVFDIEPAMKPSQIRNISQYLSLRYIHPEITSICYNDEKSRFARMECERVLALNWNEKPTMFSIPHEETKKDHLSKILLQDENFDHVQKSILVKRVVDRACLAYFKYFKLKAVQQL